jgi:hypothetical protein
MSSRITTFFYPLCKYDEKYRSNISTSVIISFQVSIYLKFKLEDEWGNLIFMLNYNRTDNQG